MRTAAAASSFSPSRCIFLPFSPSKAAEICAAWISVSSQEYRLSSPIPYACRLSLLYGYDGGYSHGHGHGRGCNCDCGCNYSCDQNRDCVQSESKPGHNLRFCLPLFQKRKIFLKTGCFLRESKGDLRNLELAPSKRKDYSINWKNPCVNPIPAFQYANAGGIRPVSSCCGRSVCVLEGAG